MHNPSNLKATLSTAITSHRSTSTDLAAWKNRMQTVDSILHNTKAALASLRENIRAEHATLADLRAAGGNGAMGAKEPLSDDARTSLEAVERRLGGVERQLHDCEVDVAEWTQWVVGVGVEVKKVERRLVDVERRVAEGLVAVGKGEGVDEKSELVKAKL